MKFNLLVPFDKSNQIFILNKPTSPYWSCLVMISIPYSSMRWHQGWDIKLWELELEILIFLLLFIIIIIIIIDGYLKVVKINYLLSGLGSLDNNFHIIYPRLNDSDHHHRWEWREASGYLTVIMLQGTCSWWRPSSLTAISSPLPTISYSVLVRNIQ